jgi:hypothetical protein
MSGVLDLIQTQLAQTEAEIGYPECALCRRSCFGSFDTSQGDD